MKKAFLRTAEVLLAIVIGATFLVYVFPNSLIRAQEEPPLELLSNLGNNDEFRQLVLLNKSRCIDADAEIRKFLPARFKYSYEFNMLDISELNKIPQDLPKDKRIYVDTFFIAGNNSEYKPMVLKLYYWNR